MKIKYVKCLKMFESRETSLKNIKDIKKFKIHFFYSENVVFNTLRGKHNIVPIMSYGFLYTFSQVYKLRLV